MPTPILDTDTVTADAPTLRAALDAKRDQLADMPEEQVLQNLRLDASVAAGIAIGSYPRIAQHRDEIVAQFGDAGAEAVDDLPVVALATEQAQIELAASEDDSDLREMARDLDDEHQLLLTDLDALANRKLVERSRIDAGRATQGYRALVTSTLVLVTLLRSVWSNVESKTPLTRADLDRIEIKAQRMLKRLHEREQRSTRMPELDTRARALTLLVRTYGEVRRMLTYVRWEQQDADDIAPSLYSGRRSKGGAKETEPAIDAGRDAPSSPATPTPGPAPAPTPIEPGTPNNGGAPFTA